LSPISSLKVACSRSSSLWLVLYSTPANQIIAIKLSLSIHSWDLGSSNCHGALYRSFSQNQNNQFLPLAVSVCPLTSIQFSSVGCEAVFARVDWFPPLILPKTITIALLCCHGIVVRRTAACKRHSNQSINQWQCQLLPHQSFMGLGWFIASSSNCSS
jgi:hypothetical protein